MSEIHVHVHSKEAIRPETLAKVASEFLEWMDGEGFKVEWPSGRWAGDDYETLGRAWAHIVENERGGNVG